MCSGPFVVVFPSPDIACGCCRRRFPGPAGHRVRNRCVRESGLRGHSRRARRRKFRRPHAFQRRAARARHRCMSRSDRYRYRDTSRYLHSRHGRRRQIVHCHRSRRARFARFLDASSRTRCTRCIHERFAASCNRALRSTARTHCLAPALRRSHLLFSTDLLTLDLLHDRLSRALPECLAKDSLHLNDMQRRL